MRSAPVLVVNAGSSSLKLALLSPAATLVITAREDIGIARQARGLL